MAEEMLMEGLPGEQLHPVRPADSRNIHRLIRVPDGRITAQTKTIRRSPTISINYEKLMMDDGYMNDHTFRLVLELCGDRLVDNSIMRPKANIDDLLRKAGFNPDMETATPRGMPPDLIMALTRAGYQVSPVNPIQNMNSNSDESSAEKTKISKDELPPILPKRARGRPPGSKNKKKSEKNA